MAVKQNTSKASAQTMSWVWIALVVLLVIGLFSWVWQKKHYAKVCMPQNIQLTAGQQSGAAGTIYQTMILKNTSDKKCTIGGYPTAFLYGTEGYALGSAAAARPQPAPTTITLEPNESANTVLGYPQAGNFNPGVCSAKSTALKLYLPSAVTPLQVPLEVAWCPGFSSTAVAAGS